MLIEVYINYTQKKLLTQIKKLAILPEPYESKATGN